MAVTDTEQLPPYQSSNCFRSLWLEAFAGFDPSKTYSADKILSSKSRKGNKYLHTTTVQVAQGLLQHGKRDNPLAKWGWAYEARLGYTTDAHKQAVAGVGKRVIHISYHILRTGKAYDGSRYHWTAHQTKMIPSANLGSKLVRIVSYNRQVS